MPSIVNAAQLRMHLTGTAGFARFRRQVMRAVERQIRKGLTVRFRVHSTIERPYMDSPSFASNPFFGG